MANEMVQPDNSSWLRTIFIGRNPRRTAVRLLVIVPVILLLRAYVLLPIRVIWGLAGLPVLVTLLKIARRKWRRRVNLCLKCGYNLRGGGEKCPECGRKVRAGKVSFVYNN